MSGNRAGGLKTVQIVKASKGEDWYAHIGKLGGLNGGSPKGLFAHGKVSPSEAGKLGARAKSQRRSALFVPDNSEFGDGLLEPSWKDKLKNKLRRQDV